MKRKAFTLIELLIVMAVIAILITFAIPTFRGMQQEARITKAQGDLRILKLATESYYKNTGGYPEDVNEGQRDLTAASPQILETDLYDPFGSTSTTRYAYVLNGSYYLFYSVGPDGKAVTTFTVSSAGVVSSSEGDARDNIWQSNGRQL